MKTKTLMAVIAVVGVVTGGSFMWTAGSNHSPSAQGVASVSPLPIPSDQVSPAPIKSNQSDINSRPNEEPPAIEPASADLAAQVSAVSYPPGPADSCIEMAKAVMCPFFAKIPFVREMTGQIATWGQISCPTG